jgi:hypothetical protein
LHNVLLAASVGGSYTRSDSLATSGVTARLRDILHLHAGGAAVDQCFQEGCSGRYFSNSAISLAS